MDGRFSQRPFGRPIVALEEVVGAEAGAPSERPQKPKEIVAVITPDNYWRAVVIPSGGRCSTLVRLGVVRHNWTFSA